MNVVGAVLDLATALPRPLRHMQSGSLPQHGLTCPLLIYHTSDLWSRVRRIPIGNDP
jgi:hypothetical protein